MADDGRKPLPPPTRTEEVLGWILTAVFCAGPIVLVIAGKPFLIVAASVVVGATAAWLATRFGTGRFVLGAISIIMPLIWISIDRVIGASGLLGTLAAVFLTTRIQTGRFGSEPDLGWLNTSIRRWTFFRAAWAIGLALVVTWFTLDVAEGWETLKGGFALFCSLFMLGLVIDILRAAWERRRQ